MITKDISTLKIHKLTQAQYDRELAAGRIDENAIYLTPEEEIDLSIYATKDYVNSLPTENTTYTISKNGKTVTLTGSDGSISEYVDENIFYVTVTPTEVGDDGMPVAGAAGTTDRSSFDIENAYNEGKVVICRLSMDGQDIYLPYLGSNFSLDSHMTLFGTTIFGESMTVIISGSMAVINTAILPSQEDIPTNISQLNNDSGYITNSVSNLTNYYNKTTVDSKDETVLANAKTYTNAVSENALTIVQELDEAVLEQSKSYTDTALASAKTYTDDKIDAIVGTGASETLDTIGEISAAIEDNQSILQTLNSAVGNKADKTDLNNHINNKNNPHGVTKAQIGLTNVEDKSSATIRGEITKANVGNALGFTTNSTTKYLREDGTWETPPDNNTTYSAGTGLDLASNQFSLKTAGSALGGVKTTSTVTSTSGLTATPIINGVPYYKDTTYTTRPNPQALDFLNNAGTEVDDYTGSDNVKLKAGANVEMTASNGTVTISATNTTYTSGIGLTNSGTQLKAKLKSETALTSDSSIVGTISKIYPVVTDKSGFLVVGTPAHTHSVVHTPAGTVGSKGTGITASFTGTAANHNHTFTGTETKTGGPVKASTEGDQSIEVLTSVKSNGSVSLSGGSVSLSGGGVTLSGGAVTAIVDDNGVLSFEHTNPTASLNLPSASLTNPTVSYTAPTFNSGSAASTLHKHAVTATGTVENKSVTPAGNITITDPGHNHGFTGTQATITSGTQSA